MTVTINEHNKIKEAQLAFLYSNKLATQTNELRMLSLFSGLGGMDLGFEGGFIAYKGSVSDNHIEKVIDDFWIQTKKNRFKTVFANDIFKDAKKIWQQNFKDHKEVSEYIYHTESIVDIVKNAKSGHNILPTNIDIVTGGFPCQDFSVAGKRKGFNSHYSHNGKIDYKRPSIESRGKLYIWMKDIVELTKPKMFVAENVKGLVNLSDVKQIIQDDFSKIGDGYLVLEPKVLNASHFGVPQNRERVFFIGFRKDALRFDAYESLLSKESPLSPYPKDTFSKNGINKLVLPEEVFDILVEPEISSDISQQYYSKAKYLSNGSQGQSEIPRDRPATTVRAEHHGNIEFRRLSKKNGGKFIEELDNGLLQRRLSVRECALLQSFPPNWEFVIPLPNKQNRFHVSASQAYKAIGNAVPPLLAYNLARQIQDNWSKYFYDC